jgi:hypothetical protein
MTVLDIFEKIIGHIAWPIIVLFVIYMFRKPLNSLIERTISMTFKKADFEFSIQAKIKEQFKKRGNIFKITKEDLAYDNYLDAIALLSNWFANAALFIPPDSGFIYQRETAIYALEQTEKKLKEAGRKDSDNSALLKTMHVLIQNLKRGTYIKNGDEIINP